MQSYIFFSVLSALIFISLALCPAAPLSPLVINFSDLVCYAPFVPVASDNCDTPATIYVQVASALVVSIKDTIIQQYYSSHLPSLVSVLIKSLSENSCVSLARSKASQFISNPSALASSVSTLLSQSAKHAQAIKLTLSLALARIQELSALPLKSLSSRLGSSFRQFEVVRLVIGRAFSLRIALACVVVALMLSVAFYQERRIKTQKPLEWKQVLGIFFLLSIFKSINSKKQEPIVIIKEDDEQVDEDDEEKVVQEEEQQQQELINEPKQEPKLQEINIECCEVTVNESSEKPPKLTFKSVNWDEYPYSERARLFYALNSGKSVVLEDFQKQQVPSAEIEPSYAQKAVAFYEQTQNKKLNCSEPPDDDTGSAVISSTAWLNCDFQLDDETRARYLDDIVDGRYDMGSTVDDQFALANQLESNQDSLALILKYDQLTKEAGLSLSKTQHKATINYSDILRQCVLDSKVDFDDSSSSSQSESFQGLSSSGSFQSFAGNFTYESVDECFLQSCGLTKLDFMVQMDLLEYKFDLKRRLDELDAKAAANIEPEFITVDKTVEDLDFLVEDFYERLDDSRDLSEEYREDFKDNLSEDDINDLHDLEDNVDGRIVQEWKLKAFFEEKLNKKHGLQKLTDHLNDVVGQLQIRKLQIHKEIFS